jgi:Flp pilus assembly protein TadD
VARALLACGDSERRRLEEDYPSARVHVVPFGADQHGDDAAAEPDLFARTYGVRDYVLCVARLEPRKNQLMLLEALRDDPRPVVLVAGDFSYAPDYATLCRELRRRGRTLVVGRLDSTMLAAAFREAAVHCLPSWYELPGLVSLEAASYGTPVAASSWGAARDYLGETIAYLEPDDPDSIARALDAAVRMPAGAAALQARQYTWERTAAETIALYEEVLGAARPVPVFTPPNEPSPLHGGAGIASSKETSAPPDGVCAAALASIDAFLADAERARRSGDYACVLAFAERVHTLDGANLPARELRATALARLGRLDEAEEAFTALLETAARCRAAHALGVFALDRGHLAEASTWLTEAIRDGANADSWVALGMCRTRSGDTHGAWDAFSTARDRDPAHRQALHGLITLAPELQRLSELERHLRGYLESVGDDPDVRCALASCLFAAGNVAESRTTIRAVLATAPDHPVATALATELRA